tara:strand:- start:1000 stop:1377 length:378 start_codon:yes stop_codon:yes gene_type:complete
MYEYKLIKDRIRVIDGDTIDCEEAIDLGFDISYSTKVRFVGINTPESRGRPPRVSAEEKRLGLAAKARLIELIEAAEEVVLQSQGVDKFGRCLGVIRADGVDVNKLLVEEGHARWYDGGKRKPWI